LTQPGKTIIAPLGACAAGQSATRKNLSSEVRLRETEKG
jgi:hypothetical protein